MAKITTHASDAKKKTVKEFSNLVKKYKVIAAVDVENLPAKQLNQMRDSLRGKAHLQMTKRRLLSLALKDSGKENIMDLEKYMTGMPALLFSDENPFTLFKILKKSKSPAPIKGGQIAPNDIIVPAGPTSFAPGPIIGELGQFRIITGVENGKVAVKKEVVVAKEGEEIKPALAALLTRLGIYPMEIGLNLQAAYEEGSILHKKDLDIDEDAFLAQLKGAASDAYALTIGIAYPTKDNITALIAKSAREALALADSQDILTKETVGKVLAKADAQASIINSKIPKE
ncbi:50S ribosomal protein L10 [Candidatus Woesearchaeota archaeon]|nr:50S ribosomal protein L10 [Candidatus Woesearchaeota archaeon]MCF7900874.1 50S ribosomal protein L10 [Candidatus Woesearchaeota archaeon]MCF8013889.1 50S ribosomal protein L10 [Candidatus Woesearchaeota archaeon]